MVRGSIPRRSKFFFNFFNLFSFDFTILKFYPPALRRTPSLRSSMCSTITCAMLLRISERLGTYLTKETLSTGPVEGWGTVVGILSPVRRPAMRSVATFVPGPPVYGPPQPAQFPENRQGPPIPMHQPRPQKTTTRFRRLASGSQGPF